MNKCRECNCDTKNPRFCSRSCSAKYNNALRGIKRSCDYCSKILPKGCKSRYYCSTSCSMKSRTKARVESGVAGIKALKSYIIETRGKVCSCCGITSWNGKTLVMQLEHIDGNSDNNNLDNLELLCPNCHSQTDTFAGRNVGNGGARSKRRMELYYRGEKY